MVSVHHPRLYRAWTLPLVLATLTLYRGWVIVHNQLPLFFDEAQYWDWSRQLDWGYFSKPPMVAWVIRLFSVSGDSELAIRLGTLLLHPLTALVAYATARDMFNRDTGLLAAMLFISMPLVGFNSLFMTTDAPLFLCWGIAVWALWHALNGDAWRHWLLLGAAGGLGLLSKYSMAIFVPSVCLVLYLPAYRGHWRNPRVYMAALLALLVFLPNVWWNAHADFVSFRHTADISQLDRALFHPAHLAEFLLAQFACMGPLADALLLAALVARASWRDARLGFLASMTLPFLAIIGLQALLARANPNWAAPACFGAALLVAARLQQHGAGHRLAVLAIATNLLLLSVFYHYRELAPLAGIELTRKSDPYSRVLGWPQVGAEVGQVLVRNPDAKLAVISRDEFALLSYYARPSVQGKLRIWNPKHRKANHYHLVADAGRDPGANFVFATRERLGSETASAFERWTTLGSASAALYPGDYLTLNLYRGEHFKGYQP